jgi:hypothetical protein
VSHNFKNHKLGVKRTPAHVLAKVPHVLDYVDLAATLPLVADTCSYTKRLPSGLWGMLGNDQYGDCVLVAIANGKNTQAANAGKPTTSYTTDQVLGWYSAVTGFKKSDPSTDNGTDPVEALDWAVKQGLVAAHGQVNLQDDSHVAAALYLFGGIQIALDFPEAWQSTSNWDVTSSAIVGGHMTVLSGYDATVNHDVETWAEIVRLTNRARKKYGQAGYVIITNEWLAANGKTIQGLDIAGLKAASALVK